VRYLGFENGINAFKPHSSVGVYENRYGDCKDKSLLLVGLLQGIGVDAAPMLVNTNLRHSLKQEEVSPFLFNHCVVVLANKGDTAFIDPTISNMGNQFLDVGFTDYGKGLIIAKGSKSLYEITQINEGKIEVFERFKINSPGTEWPITLHITTVYEGMEADEVRGYFSGNNIDVLSKVDERYYGHFYPNIEGTSPLLIEDDRDANIITTEKTYEIDSLWTLENDTYRARFFNSQLNNIVIYGDDKNRTAPLRLTYPKRFIYNRILSLPSYWDLSPSTDLIESEEYRYTYNEKVFDKGRMVVVRQVYETKANEVAAEDYDRLVRDHDKIRGQLFYEIARDKDMNSASFNGLDEEAVDLFNSDAKQDLFVLIYMIIMFVVALIFILLLLKSLAKFDPLPELWVKSPRKHIGGWLLLFTIIQFFVVFFALGSFLDFSIEPLSLQELFSFERNGALVFTVFLRKIFYLLLFIYSLFALRHLLKRRVSAIKLLKIQILALTIAEGVFLLLLQYLSKEWNTSEWFIFTVQSLLAGIWYFYLSNSKRVAETLITRIDGGLIYTRGEQLLMPKEESGNAKG